ncbi:MAG: TetR/AcrR family transcriptional regulator [Tabrizicola sp.]|uniref:TetR/AcrR family transcriptional regulator n=1 Tax=Tabrizicola sp. TaxID=2005166 RepID=UPI002732C73F|nr:TetR/AcrR family transcriptional regulator [Tabrizicola sp.]MDP3264119.1 TetR/AcrR family transcriptional regulator [Tabrizicola sp.]MDP3648748.1 TetR/AcrR family transcriptional regulator [Paracoccaceae bacterium]MDZ4065783.1 TetR/AcrR family transcriptional regulator [Tabrizicola sp.]
MSSDDKPYHHGDLRAALLAAAEAELAERGIEAFSLRSVAKRAGVSHAAPAHHFGDAGGLLTALAAEGFRQFLAAQAAREAVAAGDPASQLVAAGLGYVDFAIARPTLFRLLWQSDRPDFTDADLGPAARAAYQHLVDQVMAAGGRTTADEAAVWAIAHGLADLLAAGRLRTVGTLPTDARDAMVAGIIRRALP